MKSDGLAVDFISKYTGLSLDEIKELYAAKAMLQTIIAFHSSPYGNE